MIILADRQFPMPPGVGPYNYIGYLYNPRYGIRWEMAGTDPVKMPVDPTTPIDSQCHPILGKAIEIPGCAYLCCAFDDCWDAIVRAWLSMFPHAPVEEWPASALPAGQPSPAQIMAAGGYGNSPVTGQPYGAGHGYGHSVPGIAGGQICSFREASANAAVRILTAAKRDARGWLICQGSCGTASEYAEPKADGTFICRGCQIEQEKWQ